jgi:dUTPase
MRLALAPRVPEEAAQVDLAAAMEAVVVMGVMAVIVVKENLAVAVAREPTAVVREAMAVAVKKDLVAVAAGEEDGEGRGEKDTNFTD